MSDEEARLPEALRDAQRQLQSVGATGHLVNSLALLEQLKAVFNLSPVAISLIRSHDDVYVHVNPDWCALTGVGLSNALGVTPTALGFWGDDAVRKSAIHTLRKSGVLRNFDLPFVRPDGSRRIIQLNASHIWIGSADYFISYLEDVTTERELQAALVTSEQELKTSNDRLSQQVLLFESMENLANVGYWTSGADPSSLRWSKGMYQLAGLEPGSVTERAVGRGRIHQDDQELFALARAKADDAIVEYRWHHPDGRLRWQRSRIQRWTGTDADTVDFGVVQDITNEREAALELQQKLTFIEKITHRVPGVLFKLRLKVDGHFEFPYISDSVRDFFHGLSPTQMMQDASCVLKLHHPDDTQRLNDAIKISARELTPLSQEYRLRFDDGEVRWVMGQALPEREAGGAVLWYGFITDITLRKQNQDRLRDSEERFRALTELSSDWYWEQDEQFRFTRVGNRLGQSSVQTPDDYIGKTRWDTPHQGPSKVQWAAHQAAVQAHEIFRDFEIQRPLDDGTQIWASISGMPVFSPEGKFTGYRGVGRDISARKADEARIERLAFFDVLTELPNRRLLMDRLKQALVASGRQKSTGAVLLIDLDNFKDLNDTQGHDVGDLLLKQVAQRLMASVREADTVARLGGDEFVVLLQDIDGGVEGATLLAERVGKKIANEIGQVYLLGGQEHHSTASIGVTLFMNNLQTLDELLKQADLALYESKACGRNTLRFFDPNMQALVARRTALELDLRNCVQRQELVLFYQPVVDQRAWVVGVEALVRWRHPVRGLISPADFIPVAEQTGLILQIGEWVLGVACAQLACWASQADTESLTIAVNVSARQFRHPEFVPRVLTMLDKSRANPRRLRLELTESLLLGDTQEAIVKMTALRAAGVEFSLDDFGTGYSSLSYLKLLPLQQLKIDQSFVRDVLADPSDAAIARTVLALGASLGFGVVAEGVETAGQREFLLQSGCTLFQGYLFGRPVPIDQLRLGDLSPGDCRSVK